MNSQNPLCSSSPVKDPGKAESGNESGVNTNADHFLNENDQRIDRALRASELSYRRLFEAAKDGILILDVETGRITDANPFLIKLLGFSYDEVIGKTVGELSPFKDIVSNQDILQRLQKDGYVRYENLPLETMDGRKVAVEFVCNIYEAGDKRVIQCNIRDITERKHMEDSLRESEALFRTISEASPLGIGWVDKNGDTVYANEAYLKICGATSEETIGTRCWNAIHPLDRERAMREWENSRITGETFHSERRYLHKDGRIVWASLTTAPILDNNMVRGYMEIAEDITERKRLHEHSLRAQRMESIGTLAGGIAHDLNNILAPILMCVDLLRIEQSAQVRDRVLATVEGCVVRASDIVKQVLTFARGVQGERAVLQLRHLVREVEKIARDTFPKSINCTHQAPNDLWPVSGDSTQLHQVLINLSINARDSMGAGGTLTITGENIELDETHLLIHPDARVGPYTLIKVMDSGEGIPQEIIDKIFDPFFTTKELGKGTGLGLSTAVGIVRSHGGFMNVYSEIGKGSTFKVYLPATMSGKAGETLKVRPAFQGGNGETVLVVDDEPTILRVTEAILKNNGYNVLTASNGVEAMSLYVRHSAVISVVLSDVMMPIIDGVTLIRALKKADPSIKTITATGQAEESRQPELMALGVKAFLQKPFSTEKLLTVIHQLIHG